MTHNAIAYREFCYRFTCDECGTENRIGAIRPGESNECTKCGTKWKLVKIVYDNGAVLDISPEASVVSQ